MIVWPSVKMYNPATLVVKRVIVPHEITVFTMVATGNVQLALYMGDLLHVGSNARTIVLCWSL